jgi:hypothetical protein
MTENEIKNMTFEQLFRLIRFTPIGSDLFQGAIGQKILLECEKKKPANFSEISKKIGFKE